jgi:hypothetical protein
VTARLYLPGEWSAVSPVSGRLCANIPASRKCGKNRTLDSGNCALRGP